jgi:hypothetical protein
VIPDGYSSATRAGLGLLGGAVAVTLFFSWSIRSRAEQVADALADAPPSTVAALAAAGHARIEGQARLVAPLLAPFSGRRCAYYELEIERGPASDPGDAVRRASAGTDFLLVDATGEAVVRVGRAMIAIADAHCVRGTLDGIAPERRAALTAVPGLEELGRLDARALAAVRVRECALPADARVAVAGVADAAHGRAGKGRPSLGSTPQGPLYIAVLE